MMRIDKAIIPNCKCQASFQVIQKECDSTQGFVITLFRNSYQWCSTKKIGNNHRKSTCARVLF